MNKEYAPHQQRVIDEKNDLQDQYIAMQTYLQILEKRINRF